MTIGPQEVKNKMSQEGITCHRIEKFENLRWPSDCEAVFQPSEVKSLLALRIQIKNDYFVLIEI